MTNARDADTDSGKKVQMLIQIYFPDLLPLYKDLRTQLASSNALWSEIERAALSTGGTMPPNKRLFGLANAETEKLITAADKLEAGISVAGRALANREALTPQILSKLLTRIRNNRSIPLE